MSGQLLTNQTSGPMCPKSYGPAPDIAHAAVTAMEDRLHRATEPLADADGELPPEIDKLWCDSVYANDVRRMQMFYESGTAMMGQTVVTLETYFFRCTVCGFILPAHAKLWGAGR